MRSDLLLRSRIKNITCPTSPRLLLSMYKTTMSEEPKRSYLVYWVVDQITHQKSGSVRSAMYVGYPNTIRDRLVWGEPWQKKLAPPKIFEETSFLMNRSIDGDQECDIQPGI